MELTYDWRSFHSIFYPKRRIPARLVSNGPAGPIYCVTGSGSVISAFAEGEDLSDWLGRSVADLTAQQSNRELIFFDRAQVDEWMSSSLALPHFFDQLEFLREKSRTVKAAKDHSVSRHFLLDSILGWWSKILPSAYGVFIRLEGDRDFFMTVRRGRVDSFHEPDLTAMGRERALLPNEVVKYLSEKHLVPVQGLAVSREEWLEWNEAEHPWRQVAFSLKKNRAKLVPFRWGWVTLMATRAFFRI